MSIIVNRARLLRPVIETLAQEHLEDTEALENKELFPTWELDTEYEMGVRVRYEGTLYKCLQNHTSIEVWNPKNAVSLWAEVLIPDPEVIEVWKQPESTNPYMKGDKVYYPTKDDDIWISDIDNNVYAPAVAGWTRLT